MPLIYSPDDLVYIVAGGPSLTGVDLSPLQGRRVVAINKASVHLPWAEVAFWVDFRVWHWYGEIILGGLHKHRITLCCDPKRARLYPPGVEVWDSSGAWGLDTAGGRTARHGHSSAYAAMNVCLKLGARRIVLLGVDLQPADDGRMHWHKEHPIPTKQRHLDNMFKAFTEAAPTAFELGAQIYSAGPRSRLEVFPKVDLDLALNGILEPIK